MLLTSQSACSRCYLIPMPYPCSCKHARLLSILCMLTVGATTHAGDAPTLAHAPGPRPTADQVLNAKIPGRPDSATVTPEILRNETGFARDRLYHVPPVGEHPRILFSRTDLPRIRTQLDASTTGRALWTDWQRQADSTAIDKTGWIADAYRALIVGDAARFATLWADPRNPRRVGPPGGGSNPLAQFLFYRSFALLLAGDTARAQENAVAVTTYAAWLRPQIETADKLPGAEHFWLEVRPVVGDSAQLAFLYDFAQPYMTPAQVGAVRDVLALCIRGRYGLGMDLPPHWRNWNHIGMGLYFPLYAIAIEGESGIEPRIVTRGAEVARDYILHSISTLGVGKEGMGYHTAGMAHLNVLALAMANRGTDLFTLARFRTMFDRWMLWTMQPYGRFWATNGDLGTFPPSPALVQVAHWLFPEDSGIGLVARQSAPARTLNIVAEVALLQLLCPAELGTDYGDQTPPVFPAGLPLSLHDPERGVLFTRTSWGPEALTLQFNARSDTTFPSHDHPDRGEFFFTALGQAWTVPSMRETESKYHGVITIDGIGQGYFPTPATWLDVHDSAAGTTATVDLKYCYDWRWMKSSFLADDSQLQAEPWLEWVREPRDRLLARAPRTTWERDPLPGVRAYYETWQAGDPRMWDAEDAWVLRAANVPVRKAYRSLALVRGAQPFVIVADDIRRDDVEHLYEWRMILPMTVEAHSLSGADIILGPVSSEHDAKLRGDSAYKDVGRPVAPKGTPLLLVRVLQIGKPKFPELTPNPAVETVEFVKHDDVHQFAGRSTGLGRRLVLPSRSVEPRYRVLLFPYHAGEKLPETKWETPDILNVTAVGTTSRVKFATAADGSPRLQILP